MKIIKKNKKRMLSLMVASMVTISAFAGCGKPSQEEGTSMEKLGKLEGSYKKSSFEQIDVSSDTVKWMCSAYAVYTKYNNKDLSAIGGVKGSGGEYEQERIKKTLSEGWHIENRDDVVKVVNNLITNGHREEYMKVVKKLEKKGLLDLPTDEAMANFEADSDLPRYQDAHEMYTAYGEHGMDGWDYCRALQVLGDCYQAEYINLEECLDLSLPIAKKLQSSFKSWEEVADSYIHGYAFWQEETMEDVEPKFRLEAYTELAEMPEGPYSVPYDTKLENTWSDGEQKKEERKDKEIEDGYTPIRCGETDVLQVRLPEEYIFKKENYEKYNITELDKMGPDDKKEYSVTYKAVYLDEENSAEMEQEDILKAIEATKERALEAGDTYEASEVSTMQVGDLTISYIMEQSVEKEGGSQYIKYQAWAEVGDKYLLVCNVANGALQGEALTLDWNSDIFQTLFSDIKW